MPEMAGLDEGTPLFAQVADRLAGEIADGGLAEGERVPSTNELAAFYRINPATAAKGINVLADEGLLEKRRGIGMFVATGARQRLLARRRVEFTQRYVKPLLTEAARLGIGTDKLFALILEAGHEREGVPL
jgi:DNA-binding transcriptional regulator YhcF (GntR family)